MWRTLDELAEDPAFLEQLYNEFPSQVEAISDPVQRRTFLKLMGASLALAGAGACTRQPLEKIVPYVRQPEDIIPGRPLYYATAMTIGGVASGLLVESHEGRPTKIEGNPDHPDNLGATDAFAQAAILDLYDPDRARAVTNLGEIRPWPSFLAVLRNALAAQAPLQGANFRILTETVTSPTLGAQLQDVLARLPQAKWYQWDAAGADHARAGARLAFGEYVSTRYAIAQADVIVAFDADFLACGPGSLRYAREFAARRRPEQADRMNRLYAVETMPTSTGARADHRLPGEAERRGDDRAAAGVDAWRRRRPAASSAIESERAMRWIAAVAKDLQAHRGSSVVIAGETQPPAVHALAHAMNQALGNAGRTVIYSEPIEAAPTDQLQGLRDLVGEMNAGSVDILVIVGGNPVYTAPADLNFAAALDKVPLRVHLSPHRRRNIGALPLAHPRSAFPRVVERYTGIRRHGVDRAAADRSALFRTLGPRSRRRDERDAREDAVRPRARALDGADQGRRRVPGSKVHKLRGCKSAQGCGPTRRLNERGGNGCTTGSFPTRLCRRPERPTLAAGFAAALPPLARARLAGSRSASGLDPAVLDGRFANNGWLQELPKPITKLTWDNAVMVSQATAERTRLGRDPLRVSMSGGERGRVDAPVVELRFRGRTVRGPLFVVAGHPDDCVTVHLGYGRTRAGNVGTGAGFNAYAIRPADALWIGRGVEVVATTASEHSLACTQYHHLMEGRGMVRAVTREEFAKDPHVVHEGSSRIRRGR